VKFLIGQELLVVLFLVTLGQKFANTNQKMCQKPLIYSEIIEKIPLWADFSKTAPVAILKIPIF
jgi:hypothetical protein